MIIKLPHPKMSGNFSVEQALKDRRSVRHFTSEPLTLQEVSQLLWAAQGITAEHGLRTAPSAGAIYPIEIYLVSCNVQQLASGIYKYQPLSHELMKINDDDPTDKIVSAALGQSWMKSSAAMIVIAVVLQRIAVRYRDRSERYALMEVGHVAQNVYLQATALGLGTVDVGAFYDEEVKKILMMSHDEKPLCILPIGRR